MFQSTHPHGVRQAALDKEFKRENVSIHAPTRGATQRLNGILAGQEFQSTHPHGVRRRNQQRRDNRDLCFNPRTHTGCDISLHLLLGQRWVSIHAPTRGATFLHSVFVYLLDVSIHAPTRGATNSRASWKIFMMVSIHAPTRGATQCSCA